MAQTEAASEQVLEFKQVDLSTKSIYIVEGSNNYEVYNVNRGVNPATKEHLLLFALRGSLNIDLRNWETWRDCSKATYTTTAGEDGRDRFLTMTFDVNKSLTNPTHKVKYPEDKEQVQQCVDQGVPMLVVREEDFKIRESEFPMKIKRDKAKTREIKNIISINCSHILEKRTPVIEEDFLSDLDKPFVTRVQILDKSENCNKEMNKKRKLNQGEKGISKKKAKTDSANAPINLIEKVQNLMAKASKDKVQNENKSEGKNTKEITEKQDAEEPSSNDDLKSENWSKKLEDNKEETSENDTKPLTLTQENMLVMGLKLPQRDLTTEDTKSPPWTKLSRNIYKEKKNLFGNKYASKWMRWWFEEHHQMPEVPDNPKRSGYAIYAYEKLTELNGFNNKKVARKVGATWKQESEEVKTVYVKRSDELKEQHEKLCDAYEEAIDIWRKEKQAKPKRSDGMPDCNCQYCTEEETQ